MSSLGRVGIWSGALRSVDQGERATAASRLEDLGYGAIWIPGAAPGGSGSPFPAVLDILDATERVVVATGILNLWTTTAAAVATSAGELRATHPGRFLLGLGVSHAPVVDRDQPGRYGRPVEVMETYLDELDRADPGGRHDGRVIAGLGPRMVRLAGARAGGIHSYLVSVEHTRRSRELLGPGPLLAPAQGVVLESDPAEARSIARKDLSVYFGLPNYLNNWRRLGFAEEDFEGGGSDRLIDALYAWGTVEEIFGRIGEHHDAGADHVCMQVVSGEPGLPVEEWGRLAEALRDL